ncbi:hypothetical protein D3C73_821890 [compost metagenome]
MIQSSIKFNAVVYFAPFYQNSSQFTIPGFQGISLCSIKRHILCFFKQIQLCIFHGCIRQTGLDFDRFPYLGIKFQEQARPLSFYTAMLIESRGISKCSKRFRLFVYLRKEKHLNVSTLLIFLYVYRIGNHISPDVLFVIIHFSINDWATFPHNMTNIENKVGFFSFWKSIPMKTDALGCSELRKYIIIF